MAEFWSDQEIDHIVVDYFAMLTDELVGRSVNKAARNRDLQAVIDRSKGSIEFKHQNISAVLLGLGQPWIEVTSRPPISRMRWSMASCGGWRRGPNGWLPTGSHELA